MTASPQPTPDRAARDRALNELLFGPVCPGCARQVEPRFWPAHRRTCSAYAQRHARPLGPEDRAVIASRANAGQSVPRIAADYGIPEASVRDIALGASLEATQRRERDILAWLCLDEQLLERQLEFAVALDPSQLLPGTDTDRRVAAAKIRRLWERALIRAAELGARAGQMTAEAIR